MNVALIGCGGMGSFHAQFVANCGLNLVAFADPHKEKAEALAGKYGAEAHDDGLAAIQRDDVDIVGIMTPTPTHAKYVIAAAEAGKHVFCEKPFGRDLEQCRAAKEAVDKADVKLFVGHVVRFFHEFEAIRAQIEAGKAGEVGFFKAYRGGIFPEGEDMWFRDYAMSGGAIFDMSIHDIDWVRYMFGDPERVFCQALQRDDAIDYGLLTMRMKPSKHAPKGCVAHIIGTWAHPDGFRVKVEVCGSDGMITFDSNDSSVSSMMRETGDGPKMIVPGNPVETSPYQLEWEEFLAWIGGKGEPRVTVDDAIWAVRIVSAAFESAKTGKPVTF